jgi:hypothetical protein
MAVEIYERYGTMPYVAVLGALGVVYFVIYPVIVYFHDPKGMDETYVACLLKFTLT